MNNNADFTQGSILKKLIAFMIPVLGALILQAAYGAVDLLVVGRFGTTSGPLCRIHRQPGTESCHFCCHTARHGHHGPGRPLSG